MATNLVPSVAVVFFDRNAVSQTVRKRQDHVRSTTWAGRRGPYISQAELSRLS
jgi:hypothetical protein